MPMADLVLVAVIALCTAVVAGAIVAFFARKSTRSENLADGLLRHERALAETIERNISDVNERLGSLKESTVKLDALHSIFTMPQSRGAFGEHRLEMIVQDMLPSQYYEFQRELSNHNRVDCLIKLPAPPGNIAVDSKFPLDNYMALDQAGDESSQKRERGKFAGAVKKHINDIADRYVGTEETGDYALMFVPSEAIFLEIHERHHDVVSHAQEKKVYMVSPSTMMATVMAINGVVRDADVDENARQIQARLTTLVKASAEMVESLNLARKQASLSQNNLENAARSADALARSLRQIKDSSADDEAT